MGILRLRQSFPLNAAYSTEIEFDNGYHIYSNRRTMISWFEIFAIDSLYDMLHLYVGRDYRGWI